jgi:hypothetical protein
MGDGQVKLYKPVHHRPPSGRGYEGAGPWSLTPLHAPYEPSFITIPEFPSRRFWTWGIFTLLEQVGEEVLAELQAGDWEPWNDETRELFLLLESQFGQTLIVVEAQDTQRCWARTADIQHAQRYPVLLTYQSGEEEYPHSVPPEMVIGACALVGDGSSFHLYTAEQLSEEGRTLCAQISEGMLLYPPEVDPSAEERCVRVEQRLAAWERTHTAARRLSSLYWMLHQHTIGLDTSSPPRTLPAVPVVVDKGALIASALPVQAVIAAYSNAHSGAEQWSPRKQLPTYAYSREDGTTHIQMRPGDPEAVLDPAMIKSLWEQVRHLSDIDGDVLLTMIAQAIAAPHDEKGGTWITSKAILDYRGIKPITKKENGRVRRAGHRQEDLAEVASCISRMSNTWITVEQWIEGDINQEQQKKRSKRQRKYLYTRDSRLIVITDTIRQQELLQGSGSKTSRQVESEHPSLSVAWRYQLGSWLDPFLQGANRQMAWLLQQVLSYDPYHQMWEKRLGRYFTFHMHMDPRGGTTITREIGTLIEELSLPVNCRDPERTRQRLEKALRYLVGDGIISSWNYHTENPKLPSRKWLETWLRCKVQASTLAGLPEHHPSLIAWKEKEGRE